MISLTFGEAVREVRRARGMTQAKLAELAQISRTNLVRIERDQVSPNQSYQWIVNALGFNFGQDLEAAAVKIARKRARTTTTSTPRRKECVHCGRRLPASAFRPNPRMRSGLNSYCRECHVSRTRQWRAENADTNNARKRATWAKHRRTINARRRRQWKQRRDEVNAHRREIARRKSKARRSARAPRR